MTATPHQHQGQQRGPRHPHVGFPPVVGTAALDDLMAQNMIIDPIANEEPFPFPVTAEGDAALVFVRVCVTRIPSRHGQRRPQQH
jgi:hypothetical protein